MFSGMPIEIKRVKLTFLVLAILVISSYAFFSMAEENSGTQNNIFMDPDQDGLSSQEEKLYGTDPDKADTDGDGYSDGAEVKSGYNPLKAAPDDKLMNSDTENPAANNAEDEKNITKDLANKISAITLSPDSEEKNISLDEIKSMVNESLDQNISEDELPQIDPEDLKIIKQNYKGTAEEINARKKEDFAKYIVAVYYILSSNSPEPITSGGDVTSIADSVFQKVITALTNRDTSSLSDLSSSGEKILEQLKNVEIPEELVDIHIKGMQFAQYSIQMEDLVAPNAEDPMADIANLSKIQSLVETLMVFSTEIQGKFAEYGLQYDDAIKGKIESYGAVAPALDDLNNETNE